MTHCRFCAALLHQQEVRLPRTHQRTKGRSRIGEDPGIISAPPPSACGCSIAFDSARFSPNGAEMVENEAI